MGWWIKWMRTFQIKGIIRWRWSFLPFCYIKHDIMKALIIIHPLLLSTINIKTFFGRVSMEKVGGASRYRVHPSQAWNDSRAMSTKLLLKQPLKIKLNMAWSHMPQRRWKHPVSFKKQTISHTIYEWVYIYLHERFMFVTHEYMVYIYHVYVYLPICVCFLIWCKYM